MNQWQSLYIMASANTVHLRLVVSGRCFHVSETKFQDKFASLRQVNSPNSWDKFQICCTDAYLIRFLPNFPVFCVFLWISRDFANLPEFHGSATAWNIRSSVLRLRNVHVHVRHFKCPGRMISCATSIFWIRHCYHQLAVTKIWWFGLS